MNRRFPHAYALLAGFVFLTLLSSLLTSAAVISIDFGAESYKVALIKSGHPLDIVLNKESKRKTPSFLYVNENERLFGNDAKTLITRYPSLTYRRLKDILGLPCNNTLAVQYSKSVSEIKCDAARNSILFTSYEESPYSLEEVTAMILEQTKEQVLQEKNIPIRDCVITVPRYFTQSERQALLDAAEIGGLNVMELMNEDLAVALNYASTRSFPTPQVHIFYDMGASSTKATLVSFREPAKEGKSKSPIVPEIAILSYAHDRTLGGNAFDYRLLTHLAQSFAKKEKLDTDIFQVPRAIEKFRNEAYRVKHILSANQDTTSSIENAYDGRDFRLKVTRKEFEDLNEDLFARVTKPIEAALKNGNVTLDNVTSIVLVGGGFRIPKIQTILRDTYGEAKLAHNINADEANVLGAALRAANLSASFRLRKIYRKDTSFYPIEIEVDESESKPLSIINAGSIIPVSKSITFDQRTDFSFKVSYGNTSSDDFAKGLPIARVNIGGVADAFKKYEDREVNGTRVKVTVQYTESGIINITRAFAIFDVYTVANDTTKDSIFGKIASYFSGEKANKAEDPESEEKNDKSEEVNAEGKKTADDTPEVKKVDDETTTSNTADSEPEKPKVLKSERVPLTITIEYQGVPPLTPEQVLISQKRLRDLNKRESLRKEKDEARNAIEAFAYNTLSNLEDEDFKAVSSSEALEQIQIEMTSALEWLETEEALQGTTQTFKTKLQSMRASVDPILVRKRERQTLPPAVKQLRMLISKAREAASALSKRLDLETEILSYEKDINATETWLDDNYSKQQALPLDQDPVIVTQDVLARIPSLERSIRGLEILKRRPLPTPTISSKAGKTTKKNQTNGTSANSTEEEILDDEEKAEDPLDGEEDSDEKAPEPEGDSSERNDGSGAEDENQTPEAEDSGDQEDTWDSKGNRDEL